MLCNRLKKIREVKNISQPQLAKLLNTSKATISRVEDNLQKPGSVILTALQKTLNVNVNWLLTGEGSMFLEEVNTVGAKYPEIDKFLEKTGLKEQDIMKILKMYSQVPSQKAFELFIQASKGNKTAIKTLLKYFESLRLISDE